MKTPFTDEVWKMEAPSNGLLTIIMVCFTVSSPTSEESFQFGGYMPSAAASGQSRSRGGLARPDTAPSSTKRSVRFSDDLGLDDELFGSERPSTAPSQRSARRQTKREEKDESFNGSYLDDRNKKPQEDSKPTTRETRNNGRYLRVGISSFEAF